MLDLKLDDSGDIAIANFDLVLVDGADQIRQRLNTRLKTFLGEWFLDTDRGVPYFQEIFKKNPDLNRVISIVQEQILLDPEVIEIETFSNTYDNSARRFTYSFTVKTIYGSVSLEGGDV